MKEAVNQHQVNGDITFEEAFKVFMRVKRNAKKSDNTIRYYEDNYSIFTNFFNENNFCSTITEDTIQEYIEYLRNKNPNLKDTSINTYLRAVRSMLYYFMERKYLNYFKIRLINEEEPIKIVYTDDEINRILKKPNFKVCNFAELRNWALSNYMYATGNRLRTITEIKIKDLDFENHVVYLRHVKNKRQYIMPLSTSLETILLEYLSYKTNTNLEDYLFPSSNGKKLSKDGFTTAIYRYNKNRGVLKTSSHLYRHLFSKIYITKSKDVPRLQRIIGSFYPSYVT